ncbi:MAG: rRNA maturation RNase YbeY [Chloroflexi bacterium]|nr:rRNA maturation RNase YbeY [Chloroflexota bacterium]
MGLSFQRPPTHVDPDGVILLNDKRRPRRPSSNLKNLNRRMIYQMDCNLQIAEDVMLVDAMPADALMKLEALAAGVMNKLDFVPDTGLAIYVATDEYVQSLNHQYRGVDVTTDVLTFPAEPMPEEFEDEETPYAGDIILAYRHILEQAAQSNHAPADEFGLLVIHGLLHLAGYDHDTPDRQKVMWEKQAELLALFNIPIVVPDFIHGPDEGES